MHDKLSQRIERALQRLPARVARSKKPLDPAAVNRQIGRILQQNQRAAARFAIALTPDACPAGFRLSVGCKASFDDWAALSQGAYLLRSNIGDWSDQQLWKAYIQLTQAEVPLLPLLLLPTDGWSVDDCESKDNCTTSHGAAVLAALPALKERHGGRTPPPAQA
jgi:hypothetical protein